MMRNSFSRYENQLLLMLFFAFGFVNFDRLAISFLFPFMSKDLGLSATKLGLLSSALALTWALSGWIAGLLSDATGRRKHLLICMICLFSVCSIFSGLVSGFGALLICRIIMGIAEGPVLPLSQALMAFESTSSRRGFNMGFLQAAAAGLLGMVVGPLVIIGTANAYNWRVAFFITGLPGIILAVVMMKFLREPSKISVQASTVNSTEEDQIRLADVLKRKNVILCAAVFCCFVTWLILLLTFTPAFLVNVKHISPQRVGGILALMGVAVVLWGCGLPLLSDRVGRKPIVIFGALVSAVFPVALLQVGSSELQIGAVMLLTFVGVGCFPLVMATIPFESVPARYLAGTLGLIAGMGELVGGMLAPTIAGVQADLHGLFAPLIISAGAAVLAAVLSCGLTETAPMKIRPKSTSVSSEFLAP